MMENKYYITKNFTAFILLLISIAFFICPLIASLTVQPGGNSKTIILREPVLIKVADLLENKYVLPERAKQIAVRFREKYESGCYNSDADEKEFARHVNQDLLDITNDRHINFRMIEPSEAGEKTENSLHHPIRYYLLGIKENQGFEKLEWMEGNIGYLKLTRFYYFPDIKKRVVAAIDFLSNANAIIIDLRENGGGSGDFLSSYFLPYPTQLNSWYSREDNLLTEYWTIREIGTDRLTDVPLFLLTSSRTFSAAESFAYDMQVRKRAIIIGDSTKGGAHAVDLFQIDDRFEIYLPTVRAINPVTGKNWEGTGVVPDVLVPSDFALDTALVRAGKAAAAFAGEKETRLKQAVGEMQVHMDHAEKLFRGEHLSAAQSALDSVFQVANNAHMVNEFFIDVLAYNYFSPEDERILYAVLKKKIEFFPDSPSAYESLAYAYYKNNRKALSIANYQKLLELDPDNRQARQMIEYLQSK